MTMTQRYAGMLRRTANKLDATLAEAVRQAARHMEEVQAGYDALRMPWQPMDTAPKDGTAVLALLEGSDIPHAVRYTNAGWVVTWDNHLLGSADGPRFWMPVTDDPDA